VIAPFPPGSAGDIIPRAIAPNASEALKQNIIIDNRPGAAGNIAAELLKWERAVKASGVKMQ